MTIQFDAEGFATASGEMLVFICDADGVFSHSEMQWVSEGAGLPPNTYLDVPPEAKDGLAIVRQDGEWVYIADHRGETVYSTTDKTSVTMSALGDIPEGYAEIEPPSPYHSWQDGWVMTPEDTAKQLAEEKSRKLAEINQKAQAFVNGVAKLDETPDFEQATWQEQANEARAWFADKSAPTPKLALLATLRGVPLDVLRQKCYDKAQAFYQLSFAVAGQRQRYEDQLKQAGTLAEISAISPEFSLEVANG